MFIVKQCYKYIIEWTWKKEYNITKNKRFIIRGDSMKYALTNCIILNGKKDMEPLKGYSIIVDDGKIVEITNKK